jgi:hypothetical protein
MSDLHPVGGTGELGSNSERHIVIPYAPRDHFKPLHASKKRFRFVVAHRRAGKSVAEINELIKRALQNDRVYPPPRYAYIGPTFAQTKDLIWGYTKHYTGVLPEVSYSEGDLQVKLPNGALINLYGGSTAYERMRGLYFDGAVADEYAMLSPEMWGTVVRPCLSDYRGWFIASGTSNGDDHFHDLKLKAEANPDEWDVFVIPVTETDALHPDEIQEMTRDMTPEQFAREMLCSFEAPVEGAYYADIMNQLELDNHIIPVPYDPAVPVYVSYDLGIDDEFVMWFWQFVGKSIHIIDHYSNTGKGLDHYFKVAKEKPYIYGMHVPPHDVKARELGTGRSRFELFVEQLKEVFVCPMHKVEDRISAVRAILPRCYFDKEKTAKGRISLRNYRHTKEGKPIHNWASHDSDGFGIGAVGIPMIVGSGGYGKNVIGIGSGRLRRRIRGLVK